MKLVWGALITSAVWVVGTLLTPAEHPQTLQRFVDAVRPERGAALRRGLLSMALGTMTVYAALFAVGNWIYGVTNWALGLTGLAVVTGIALFKVQTHRRP